MKSLATAFKNEKAFSLKHYDSMEALIAETVSQLQPNDTVVIKGSRGMRMERIWEAVKQSVTTK